MILGLTGAGGFIGARIIEFAVGQGHTVIGFTRTPEKKIPGCSETRRFSLDEKVDVDGCAGIIHLAGEPVFGIWIKAKRQRIHDSRALGTRHLVDAILAAANPPRVLVSSSAIGYYGDTGETETNEDSPPGHGFLPEVCQAWEREALRAREKNVRVVLLRTSVVLGPGGAMGVMLPFFNLGLGGKLGSGRQWMSWIHLDDEAALALHALQHDDISGPINAIAPQPCRNEEFTRALSRVARMPAFLNVPAFVLKTLLGDFSHELLDSKRIISNRLTASGFTHRFPDLDTALADIAANWNCSK
ncbi:MAG TPA: TIGR01777 family oxidoreductase [Chthoniobacteraceae bacterium]|nr:TIGR01777 family oxidoreductase [Chthoniobacteraceae bacterium]